MKSTFFILSFILFFSLISFVSAEATAPAQTVTLPNPIGSVSTIGGLLNMVVDFLVIYVGTVGIVLGIMYAGYLFLSSQGDPEKITQARHTIIYSLLGYAIILLAKGIVIIVNGFFSQ